MVCLAHYNHRGIIEYNHFMSASTSLKGPLSLEPQYREYIWGGNHLRPGQVTAECWVVHEGNRISSGPLTGLTLAEISTEFGPALLGERAVAHTGARFPLLIKLLDCAQWLSLQVHPNDHQALQLEGPGHFGKTEAWHILNADPGAEILCGFIPGMNNINWQLSVRDGAIIDYAQRVPAHTGDSFFIRPGTLHALGPGLLVYEIQQTSDITYRVFDWNRATSNDRPLHIEQSIAVLDPSAQELAVPPPPFVDGAEVVLITCPYFTLKLLTLKDAVLASDTLGQSFHSLTVIEGQVLLQGRGWQQALSRYETALIPANSGDYQITPLGQVRVLKASVE